MGNLTLGIDPGIAGALAIIDADFRLVSYLDTPTMQLGKSKRVNGSEIARWLKSHQEGNYLSAYLERVGAMPGQGVTSMFSFGHAAGVVEGILAALYIPYTLVTPQVWKRHFGLVSGAGKDASRTRAIQLYPEAPLQSRNKGQALADAILIARYGLETKVKT